MNIAELLREAAFELNEEACVKSLVEDLCKKLEAAAAEIEGQEPYRYCYLAEDEKDSTLGVMAYNKRMPDHAAAFEEIPLYRHPPTEDKENG